ncbi:MAG: TIGR03086 family metal-binding protein [Aquihabitans sp.]
MTQKSGVLFVQGLDVFGSVMDQMEAADWERATPCEGWRALDVLGHLGSALEMGISILRNEQPSWPQADRPGDLIDGDPVAYWQNLAAQSRDALEGVDLDVVMDTSMGPRSVADRIAFPAIDLFVHAWDIGQAIGVTIEMPAEVIEFTHGYIDPMPVDKVRGPEAAFRAEVTPAPDASPTNVFMAWTGRTPLLPA